MTFEYWRGQRPRKVSSTRPSIGESLPAPVPADLTDEFTNREWGSQGETFAPQPQPQTTLPAGLVIEPPPWAGQSPLSAPEADTGLSLTAAERMKLDSGEVYDPDPYRGAAGFEPFWGCPLDIPKPDWRAEEP